MSSSPFDPASDHLMLQEKHATSFDQRRNQPQPTDPTAAVTLQPQRAQPPFPSLQPSTTSSVAQGFGMTGLPPISRDQRLAQIYKQQQQRLYRYRHTNALEQSVLQPRLLSSSQPHQPSPTIVRSQPNLNPRMNPPGPQSKNLASFTNTLVQYLNPSLFQQRQPHPQEQHQPHLQRPPSQQQNILQQHPSSQDHMAVMETGWPLPITPQHPASLVNQSGDPPNIIATSSQQAQWVKSYVDHLRNSPPGTPQPSAPSQQNHPSLRHLQQPPHPGGPQMDLGRPSSQPIQQQPFPHPGQLLSASHPQPLSGLLSQQYPSQLLQGPQTFQLSVQSQSPGLPPGFPGQQWTSRTAQARSASLGVGQPRPQHAHAVGGPPSGLLPSSGLRQPSGDFLGQPTAMSDQLGSEDFRKLWEDIVQEDLDPSDPPVVPRRGRSKELLIEEVVEGYRKSKRKASRSPELNARVITSRKKRPTIVSSAATSKGASTQIHPDTSWIDFNAPSDDDLLSYFGGVYTQVHDLSGHWEKLDHFAFTKGGNSDIYKARLTQGSHPHGEQLVAVKVLRSVRIRQGSLAGDVLQKRLQREMQAWSRLDHCNIVPFLGYGFEGLFPCLFAPWYNNGDLTDYIRLNPDCNRTRLVTQSIDGVVYLHSLQPPVIHGDLKAPNVLVDNEGKARITDFGLSRVLQDGPSGFTTSSTAGGTHRWMAPELLDGDCLRPTSASDVYSLALLALEIYTQKQPFPGMDQGRFFRAIFKGQSPERAHYHPFNPPDQIWQVFEGGWSFDPTQRPTALGIKDMFANALAETGWQG